MGMQRFGSSPAITYLANSFPGGGLTLTFWVEALVMSFLATFVCFSTETHCRAFFCTSEVGNLPRKCPFPTSPLQHIFRAFSIVF